MVKLSGNKARQGRRGTRVLVILVVGLALAMLVWWGAEWYGEAIAPEEPMGEAPQEQVGEPEQPATPQQAPQ